MKKLICLSQYDNPPRNLHFEAGVIEVEDSIAAFLQTDAPDTFDEVKVSDKVALAKQAIDAQAAKDKAELDAQAVAEAKQARLDKAAAEAEALAANERVLTHQPLTAAFDAAPLTTAILTTKEKKAQDKADRQAAKDAAEDEELKDA